MTVDIKAQRMSDLSGSSTELYNFMSGLRGILETARRAGNAAAVSEAEIWLTKAGELHESINDAIDRESTDA